MKIEGKKLVICFDGTGNEFFKNHSNVVTLCRVLEQDSTSQLVFYDSGVGTRPGDSYSSKLGRKWSVLLGNMIGKGVLQNVQEAYNFLMTHYQKGDKIILFGFSRGAYTARVLAAFIHGCGLLRPGLQNLVPYALDLLDGKRVKGEVHFGRLRQFRKTFSCEPDVNVELLGLWDAVSTFGWIHNPIRIPWTVNNPGVRKIRHAISIDERRVLFPPFHGGDPEEQQDVKKVWFAGVHADVGGSYPEEESGLAKITLDWMIQECQEAVGLEINQKAYKRYVQGDGKKYFGPNAAGDIHNSLTWQWRPFQFVPVKVWDDVKKKEVRAKPKSIRVIDHGSRIHESVLERMEREDLATPYLPVNLPGTVGEIKDLYEIESWGK